MATDNKYDRQLRLWGANGQRSLSETTVVLIRATAAGTETLKNLVLPGIGQFVILDDAIIGDEYKSNFFVSQSSSDDIKPTSLFRGQVAVELLQELNPDVRGSYYDTTTTNNSNKSLLDLDMKQTLQSIMAKNPKLLVVGADLEPPLLIKVSAACVELKLPLVAVQSYGLIGTVRVQSPPLVLLDPKPDSEVPDLRLVSRFPELSQLVSSMWSNEMTSAEYGHVPYPIILMKFIDEWKAAHNGQFPQGLEEKQQFQAQLKQAGRKFDPNGALNFEEASSMAYLAYTQRDFSAERIEELLDIAKTHGLETFQVLLEALQQFVARHNQVPLHGTIPDMTASTDRYIQLQQVYQTKAKQDLEEMQGYLSSSSVSNDDLFNFIKNIFSLDVLVSPRNIQQEYAFEPTTADFEEMVGDWAMATFDPCDEPHHTPLLWYMALRACHVFYTRHGHYPGRLGSDYVKDVDKVQACIVHVAQGMQLSNNDLVQQTLLAKEAKFAMEMCRYANAQVHAVAAVVGGVAAQEAVKVITGQYVPLDNTYVYNGIASTGGVYRF